MRDTHERDHIREQLAGEPGRGHLIEQLAAQRENLVGYGQDTADVDARLAELGYAGPAAREAAAAQRREAAHEPGARKSAPAGRTTPRRSTTGGARARKS